MTRTAHVTIRSIPWSPILVVIFLSAGQTGVGAESDKKADPYDCGTIALHTILMLEGHPTPVIELEKILPQPPKAGYSMAQLRDAARASGLELIGVRLRKGDRSVDRPALVHLARGEHGHFVVVRPVGHSGKLVQVLDASGAPTVVDLADFQSSPEWTGLALVPARSASVSRAAFAAPLFAALPVVYLLAKTVRRRRENA